MLITRHLSHISMSKSNKLAHFKKTKRIQRTLFKQLKNFFHGCLKVQWSGSISFSPHAVFIVDISAKKELCVFLERGDNK